MARHTWYRPAPITECRRPGPRIPEKRVRSLCGRPATYQSGGRIRPSTTVDSSPHTLPVAAKIRRDHEVYLPQQLPCRTLLAREFLVCDNWHASMPGPTWPNRMFVHAASSRVSITVQQPRKLPNGGYRRIVLPEWHDFLTRSRRKAFSANCMAATTSRLSPALKVPPRRYPHYSDLR